MDGCAGVRRYALESTKRVRGNDKMNIEHSTIGRYVPTYVPTLEMTVWGVWGPEKGPKGAPEDWTKIFPHD